MLTPPPPRKEKGQLHRITFLPAPVHVGKYTIQSRIAQFIQHLLLNSPAIFTFEGFNQPLCVSF